MTVEAPDALVEIVEAIIAQDGWVGWVLIAGVVAGWNGRCIVSKRRGGHPHEMLSTFAGRHPAIFAALMAYLACHFARWPRVLAPIDPLHRLFAALERVNLS